MVLDCVVTWFVPVWGLGYHTVFGNLIKLVMKRKSVEYPRLVHGPRHGLLVSIMTGPIYTKLAEMWNRLGISRVRRVFTALQIAPMRIKPVIPLLEVEQKKGKWTLFYCCFGDCEMLVHIISACDVDNLSKTDSNFWQKSGANHEVDGWLNPCVWCDAFKSPWHVHIYVYLKIPDAIFIEHIFWFTLWNTNTHVIYSNLWETRQFADDLVMREYKHL